MADTADEPYWSTRQVAVYTRYHPATIAIAASKGELQADRPTSRGPWKHKKSWVDAWMRQDCRKPRRDNDAARAVIADDCEGAA